MTQNGKTLLWLGTATYATLAVLAYVFYQERTVLPSLPICSTSSKTGR